MYHHMRLQMGDAREKIEIFEQMERHVKIYPLEEAVSNMEYALFYYPRSLYQIEGSDCYLLVETVRRNSVRRMVATLKERFPESCKGNSPIAWIEAYGRRGKNNKIELDEWRESDWYKEWYGEMEWNTEWIR